MAPARPEVKKGRLAGDFFAPGLCPHRLYRALNVALRPPAQHVRPKAAFGVRELALALVAPSEERKRSFAEACFGASRAAPLSSFNS